MYNNRKKSKMDDKEFIDSESNEELFAVREEVEFLRQLIETQASHIHFLQEELVEVHQELEVVNDELGKTIMSGVSFEEAKAVAKTMLNSQEFSSELVENLLNIIYGLSSQPEDLKQRVKFDIQMSQVNNQLANKVVMQSQELRKNSEQMRNQYKELGCRFVAFKASLNKIQKELNNYNKKSSV